MTVRLGPAILIPLCSECGGTSDSWMHDDRDPKHHAFVPMRPRDSRDNGVYEVTEVGDSSKPTVMTRSHVDSPAARASIIRAKIAHHRELWETFDRSGDRKARSAQAALLQRLETELAEVLRRK